MSATQTTEKFVPLREAAIRLGLPMTWLESEAKAGRIPHLKAANRRLFHVDAVERALLDRTAVTVESQPESGETVVDRAAFADAPVK